MNKGDWALVTGASSGIGKAFAECLAQRGLHLVMVALHEEPLANLARQWEEAYGIQCVSLSVDLADPASAQIIHREIQNRNLSIDVLVNSAGFGYFGDFQVMPADQITKMVQVNATSIAALCRCLLPSMQARNKGAIINVASVAGFIPYPFAAVYSATKSFIITFTKAIWAENQAKNVRILLLCPGYTKTNFEKVSTEPSRVHLFSGEDPHVIAEKALSSLSSSRCQLFSRCSHPIKILGAKILPPKAFAGILRHLRNKG